MSNYQKKQTIVKLRKTYSLLSQAFELSKVYNGEFSTWKSFQGTQNAGEVYFDTYWKSYLKISSKCKETECGYKNIGSYADVWYALNGSNDGTGVYYPSPSRIGVTLNDGTFLLFLAYTDTTIPTYVKYIIADINGTAPPNTLGIDVFRFVATDSGLKPDGYDKTDEEIKQSCSKTGNGRLCAAYILNNGWNFPDDYPDKF